MLCLTHGIPDTLVPRQALELVPRFMVRFGFRVRFKVHGFDGFEGFRGGCQEFRV